MHLTISLMLSLVSLNSVDSEHWIGCSVLLWPSPSPLHVTTNIATTIIPAISTFCRRRSSYSTKRKVGDLKTLWWTCLQLFLFISWIFCTTFMFQHKFFFIHFSEWWTEAREKGWDKILRTVLIALKLDKKANQVENTPFWSPHIYST